MKMAMLVFWVVTPCGLVGRYQRFEETYPENSTPTFSPSEPQISPKSRVLVLKYADGRTDTIPQYEFMCFMRSLPQLIKLR
jgi:hypothetical protein